MAANNYLMVDTSKPLAAQLVSLHDQLINLMALTNSLRETLLQVNADGSLVSQLGITADPNATDNANAILTLIGSLDTNFENPANAFLQFTSRIGRKSFS